MSSSSIWHAELRDVGIEFGPYDFPGSAFYPGGLCPWSQIREIDPSAAPPEVRTPDEILFVPAPQKDELARAAASRSIPVVQRFDVWGLLLEPFLDTSFDDAAIERTYRVLGHCGISRGTCDALRAEVGPAMIAYNLDSTLWDWCSLGLLDLLSARRGVLSGDQHCLSDIDFAVFYRRAMELALRAPPLPPR